MRVYKKNVFAIFSHWYPHGQNLFTSTPKKRKYLRLLHGDVWKHVKHGTFLQRTQHKRSLFGSNKNCLQTWRLTFTVSTHCSYESICCLTLSLEIYVAQSWASGWQNNIGYDVYMKNNILARCFFGKWKQRERASLTCFRTQEMRSGHRAWCEIPPVFLKHLSKTQALRCWNCSFLPTALFYCLAFADWNTISIDSALKRVKVWSRARKAKCG